MKMEDIEQYVNSEFERLGNLGGYDDGYKNALMDSVRSLETKLTPHDMKVYVERMLNNWFHD